MDGSHSLNKKYKREKSWQTEVETEYYHPAFCSPFIRKTEWQTSVFGQGRVIDRTCDPGIIQYLLDKTITLKLNVLAGVGFHGRERGGG